MEIFFVNEKVCFEKQKFKYSRGTPFRLFARSTILYCRDNNNRFFSFYSVVFPHRWVSQISNALLENAHADSSD
uniref:Uncharacterized protein n=1 Tax=Paraburkholderia sprentiae WSM5005 TaxID=754502 RepID=A0A1I9YCS6_9BURK